MEEEDETVTTEPDLCDADASDEDNGNAHGTSSEDAECGESKRMSGTSASVRSKKPGIVYLSRIPPLMRPQRIKKIFSQYGEIGRVFLQPEDKFKRKSRKKKGGSKAKFFTEGWVEFTDKGVAKRVALTLNNTAIGGRRRSRCYEELWNIRYLHRFRWAHLVERLAYERQVRQQRVRTEIAQAKRATDFYLKSAELGDRLDRLERKKREKGREWISRVRAHRQKVTQDEHDERKKEIGGRRSGKVSRDTLSKIFKKSGGPS